MDPARLTLARRPLASSARSDSHSVPAYLQQRRVQRHTGSHNLKSSWVSGVNTYFPFGRSQSGRALIAAFLASHVDDRVRSVDSIELEWAGEGELSPSVLLGEGGGSRGSGQTSPDLAFPVNGGAGLLLVENKLTEHSFYPCSARHATGSDARPANPDLSAAIVSLRSSMTCRSVSSRPGAGSTGSGFKARSMSSASQACRSVPQRRRDISFSVSRRWRKHLPPLAATSSSSRRSPSMSATSG